MSHNTKMPEGLLPLFPLELVLLPHTPLPLHIFEDRYREMINECLALQREFGVILVRGNGVLRTGCTASIEQVLERHADGRMDILTRGRRRFEIESIDTGRAFYRADVRYFDDEDPAPAASNDIVRARQHYREVVLLTDSELDEPDLDHPNLSFLLARISPDLNFKQTLLQIRSEASRMTQVADHLESLIVRQKTKNTMKHAARSNGHGKHLPDLSGLN